MKNICFIWLLFISALTAQQANPQSTEFRGQLSVYSHYNENNVYPWWNGGRYIPQWNWNINPGSSNRFDLEASANLYGNAGLKDFENFSSNGSLKPYRMWVRYSTNQFELRAGLQKINFGSATILRPLMWFDQVDPRDPLQLTDGVWGLLARYYFLNNSTIWLWTLYGNDNPKGWELTGTNRNIPEAGGRIQVPSNSGEAAFSYHYRVADSRNLSDTELLFDKIPEHRIGFDARFDWVVGFWMEASWKKMNADMAYYTNQELMNIGTDYTFSVGNGLSVIYEQLFATIGEEPFNFRSATSFSLLSATYPIGLFDNLSLIVYYDWRGRNTYNFLNWQKKFNHSVLYVMGYVNPKDYLLREWRAGDFLFAGTGIQIMFVINH